MSRSPRTPKGTKHCEACGEAYEYFREESRFCSTTCRGRMHQAGSRRARIPDSVRFDVLRRDEFACRYCGAMPDEQHADGSWVQLTVDHVVPVDEGGALTAMSNLVSACNRCNSGKGTKVLEPGEVPPPRIVDE